MRTLLWLAALLHLAAVCLVGRGYVRRRRRPMALLLGATCLLLLCHAFVTLAQPNGGAVAAGVLLLLASATLVAGAARATGWPRTSAVRAPESFEDGAWGDLPIGLFSTTPDGDITAVNPAALAMLAHHDASALLGQNACNLLVEPSLRQEDMERLDHDGRVLAFEAQLRKADGGLAWVQGNAHAVQDRRGRITSYVGCLLDITDRKQAQDQLRNSEQRFRMVLDATSDGVWDRDVVSGTCHYSPQWAEMLGYSPDELAPTLATWENLLHPEDRPRVVSALEEHLQGRAERYVAAFRMRHKDGGWRWVLSRGRVVDQDDTGRARRILGTHADISEWKRTEQELRESRERFRALIEALPDLVFQFDEAGRCLDVIAGEDNLLYRGAAEVKGKLLHEIFPERQADEFMRLHRRTFETDASQTYEYQIPVPAGLRWFEARTAILHGVAGTESRLISTVRDITARKQAEQEQRRLEAQVLQTQKLESLAILAGGVAHDFNNLLTGILGNVDLLLDDLSPVSPVVLRIKGIEESAQRAADLAEQMLAYSGRGSFTVQALDVNEVVEDMRHLLTAAISRKITLHYETAPVLPAIRGDATQIRQVLMNLARNASDAIGDHEGRVVVRTGVADCGRDYLRHTVLDEGLPEGTYAFLEVEDTGCGMDRETQERAFDPFYTTKLTGRGLGLAALLGIVRGHRGAVRVDSTPGQGSVFRVLLPAVGQSASPQAQEQGATSTWRGNGTVLVVEDEESVRRAVRIMLTRLGFSVITANDGVEGVEAFREHADDLTCVLLDLTMPRMDGKEAFEELTRIRQDVPVIVTSGYSETQVRAGFPAAPPTDFLRKPYRLEELRQAFRRVLASTPRAALEHQQTGTDTEAAPHDA